MACGLRMGTSLGRGFLVLDEENNEVHNWYDISEVVESAAAAGVQSDSRRTTSR